MSNTDFDCPHCKKKYSDINDKYLKRCNKNKSFTTKINCECGKSFYLTYDIKGEFVTYVHESALDY